MIRDTSRISYDEEKQKGLSERHALVLAALRNHGEMTDQEIKQVLEVQDPNFVRPRRFELMKAGIVEAGVKRKCRITGKTSLVWRIVSLNPKQLELNISHNNHFKAA